MRGRANTGIHHQRHIGQACAQGAQCPRVDQALAGANRRAPGHQDATADIQQALAADQVIGAVREYLEAVAHQLVGGLHQFPGIGLQGLLVANDLKLEPVRAEQLARHHRQRDGFARAAATRRVGQQMHAGAAHHIDKAVVGAGVAINAELATQAQRHHLRARCQNGLAQHLGRRVAGATQEKTAFQRHIANLPAHGVNLQQSPGNRSRHRPAAACACHGHRAPQSCR